MPKTKEQKQKEAIARNRAAFPSEIKMWCEVQTKYTSRSAIHQHGKDVCDAALADAEARLVRAAKEAHVDRHGNPLEEPYREEPFINWYDREKKEVSKENTHANKQG